MSGFSPRRNRDKANVVRRRSANWSSIGRGIPVREVDEFLKTTNLTIRSRAIDKIEKIRLRETALLVGEMSVEMAHNVGSDEANEWLDRGKASLKKVAQREITSYPDIHAAIAQRTLDYMPHFMSLCIKGELPSREWMQKMYADSQKTAKHILAGFEYHDTRRREKTNHEMATRNLSGLMAEQAVALLGLRFALKNLDDNSWVMTPSLFSENHSPFNGSKLLNSSWDLSVHTEPGNRPTYKIQVKLGEEPDRKGQVYTDDIVVMNVKEDLGLDTDRYQNVAANIIRESLTEPNDQCATDFVIIRTDKLLDKLG